MVAADTSASQFIPVIPQQEHERRTRRKVSPDSDLWDLLDVVHDPEIPALSLWDLGVLQNVERRDGTVVVTMTPTYSGCPAVRVMAEDVETALMNAGFESVLVEVRLSPAWTTDWLSAAARDQLKGYGIAPPGETAQEDVLCPLCSSAETRLISEFGSTACKALYKCNSCLEPFDYFKSI